MSKIYEFNTIGEYNEYLGTPTLHPLVSVVDMMTLPHLRHALHRFGFYTVFLKGFKCGLMQYGRSHYDYDEGTLLFIGPHQVAGVEGDEIVPTHEGWILAFHPDLLAGTSLAGRMRDFSFFSYSSNEALHMSEDEKQTVVCALENIREEMLRPADKHSKGIIVSYIEVFLNLCLRFYDRQFVSREPVNRDTLTRFDDFLVDYYDSGQAQRKGLPSVSLCADYVHLSPNYFGDLVKRETGHSAQEHIQHFVVEKAKDLLYEKNSTVSEVAYRLGFAYPHHLSRMFKRLTGLSPVEFRRAN